MNIEEKRKQIIEEVEKLEKKLDGWKFRKGASKLDENEITIEEILSILNSIDKFENPENNLKTLFNRSIA